MALADETLTDDSMDLLITCNMKVNSCRYIQVKCDIISNFDLGYPNYLSFCPKNSLFLTFFLFFLSTCFIFLIN